MATPISQVAIEKKENQFILPDGIKMTPGIQEICFDFFEAVRKNELKLVKELLEKEPKLIEARDKEGFTAFLQACFDGGSTDMLDLLINFNPAVEDQTVLYIKDSSFENIFYGHIGIGLAVARNQLHIVKHLYQKSKWKNRLCYPYPEGYPRTNGYTLFHLAAKFGHRAILEYLHPTDSRLSRMSFTRYYALAHENGDAFSEAMDNEHLDAIQYLLSLHPIGTEYAAVKGHLIYKAAKYCSLPILKCMVESNLKHFHERESDDSGYHWDSCGLLSCAAVSHKIENVKYLLSIGANIDKCKEGAIYVHNDGEVPSVRYAGTCKDPKIIEIINDCKALAMHFRRHSWEMPTLKEVKDSLDKVYTLNFTTREGTLLHLALGSNSDFNPTQEMILLLFESNLDRKIKNKDGLTALQYGVKNGKIQLIYKIIKQLIENVKKEEKLKEEEKQIKIQALQEEFDSLLQFAEDSNIEINYREMFETHGLMFLEPFANQTVRSLFKEKRDEKTISNLKQLSDLLYVGQLKATIRDGKPTFEVQLPHSHQCAEIKENENKESKENETSRILNLKLALAYAIRSENTAAMLHAGTALLGLDLDPIKMHDLESSCKTFESAIIYLISVENHKKSKETLKPAKSVKIEKAQKPKSESSLSLDEDEDESTESKVLSEDDKTQDLTLKFNLGAVWDYYMNYIPASTFLERYCAFHKIDPKDPSILALENQKPLHEGLKPFETLIINLLELERNLILKEQEVCDTHVDMVEGPGSGSGYTPAFSAIAIGEMESAREFQALASSHKIS